jgi:hypothetical protein
MISGVMENKARDGWCYSWMGKPVPRETKIKQMPTAWREYHVVLATLAENNERGLLHFKLGVLEKYLAAKDETYVSIAHHLEGLWNW